MPFDVSTVPLVPPVADVLIRAKELITTNGWCQNARMFEGRMCIDGAICCAESGNACQAGPLESAALRWICDAIGYYGGVRCNQYVFDWNDYPSRTHDEVIAVFEKAIALAIR